MTTDIRDVVHQAWSLASMNKKNHDPEETILKLADLFDFTPAQFKRIIHVVQQYNRYTCGVLEDI